VRDPFEIAGTTVVGGTTLRVGLPVSRLFTQQMLELPLIVMHGPEPGPTVWLSAAIHGDEITGTEIIRWVVEAADVGKLRGTVIGVPVVNVMGFIQQSRYLPDRRDLNRSFPGSPRGSLASRIAHLLMQQIVLRCDAGVDLHGGSHHRTNLPQARGNLDDPRVKELCGAFAAPIALHAATRRGSLRAAAADAGIPCVLYEAGEPLRMDDDAVRTGAEGVLRVLAHLGMIDDAPPPRAPAEMARASSWVRASRAGIVHLDVGLGSRVERNQRIGAVRDIYGDVAVRLRTRHEGIVIGHTMNPLVNQGDAVVNIAHADPSEAARG
jgi:predicted deacylase